MAITEQDYALLSAYLDGVLEAEEITRLEGRLEREPELQQELFALRQTVALVKSLPTLKAPRSFELTPEMAGKREALPPNIVTITPRPRLTQFVLPLVSAAASMVLVLLGLNLLLSNGAAPNANTATNSVAQFPSPTAALTATVLEGVPEVEIMEAEESAADALEESDPAQRSTGADEDAAVEEAPEAGIGAMSVPQDVTPLDEADAAGGAADTFSQDAAQLVPEGTMPPNTELAAPAAVTAETFAYATPPPAGGGDDGARIMPPAPTLTTEFAFDTAETQPTSIAQETIAPAVAAQSTMTPTPLERPASAPANNNLLALAALVGGSILLIISIVGFLRLLRR